MNRNQRRYGRTLPRRNDNEGLKKTPLVARGRPVELEVFPPKARQQGKSTPTQNRCCYVTPEKKEIGLVVNTSTSSNQYLNTEIQVFPSKVPEPFGELRDLRRVLHREKARTKKVDIGSQCTQIDSVSTYVPSYVETSDGSQWHSIENADDIDNYFLHNIDEEILAFPQKDSENIHIQEIPRIKIIAEKFTKYKKNNTQVRKLDEKIVCVEYDVFDSIHDTKPKQIMRAFFSIKPVVDDGEPMLKDLPSKVKSKFNISSDDLSKLNQKEVEIIDDKLANNQSYLNDLKKILQRKRNLEKKNRLDLQSLYEIAKKDCVHFDRAGTNALSTNELCEIKDLILTKCRSSIHKIKRRTVSTKDTTGDEIDLGISEGILTELLKDELSFRS